MNKGKAIVYALLAAAFFKRTTFIPILCGSYRNDGRLRTGGNGYFDKTPRSSTSTYINPYPRRSDAYAYDNPHPRTRSYFVGG